jgi:hypothetical protein
MERKGIQELELHAADPMGEQLEFVNPLFYLANLSVLCGKIAFLRFRFYD